MGINASNVKSEGKKFAPQPDMEAGQYPARLVQVIDWGLQAQRPYEGQEKPPAHTVNFTFELVDAFMVDEEGNDMEDKPRWVSKDMPLHPLIAERAASTKLAKALDPNDELQGDFGKMLGLPLNVTIAVTKKQGKTYTNVTSFGAMRAKDAEKCPELKNPTKVFDLDNPDLEVFNSLPEWMREKIKSNLRFAASPLERLLGGEAPVQRVEKEEEDPKAEAKGEPSLNEAESDLPW